METLIKNNLKLSAKQSYRNMNFYSWSHFFIPGMNVWLQLHISEANELICQLLVPTVVAYYRPCSDWSHPLVRRYPYWRRWWCCSADLFLVAHGSRYRLIRPGQTPWLKQGMKAWHRVAISVTTIQALYHFYWVTSNFPSKQSSNELQWLD